MKMKHEVDEEEDKDESLLLSWVALCGGMAGGGYAGDTYHSLL